MSEIFFGPCRIELVRADDLPRYRVVISGSQGSDGSHEVTQSPPFRVFVKGEQWTLAIHQQVLNGDWTEMTPQRTSSFERDLGLVELLDTRKPRKGPWSGPHIFSIALRVVSEDPDIVTAPGEMPWEFTYPGKV